MLNLFDSEEFALGSFERGVANHARGTTHKGDGLMACHLEVLEEHNADQVANVEGVGCWVDTDVCRGHLFIELFFCAGHDVVDHASPLEFLYKVCLHRIENRR